MQHAFNYIERVRVACVTLHTEPPIETLVFEVKPFPFNVKTKPPLLLPSTGDIL